MLPKMEHYRNMTTEDWPGFALEGSLGPDYARTSPSASEYPGYIVSVDQPIP